MFEAVDLFKDIDEKNWKLGIVETDGLVEAV